MIAYPEIERTLATRLPVAIGDARRLLLIVPDQTRSGPVGPVVQRILPVLRRCGVKVDIIVALGTHPPMARAAMLAHLGFADEAAVAAGGIGGVELFNHEWDNPAQLARIGAISAERIAEATGGLMRNPAELTINRRVLDHDHLLVLGTVFPHEVAGFSGGSKYLFPGIAGPEIVGFTHWLAAVIGNLQIIGVADNPVRKVLDEAARQVPLPISAVCMVVQGDRVAHFAVGGLFEAWQSAVGPAAQVHVVHTGRRYRQVLACCPPMYEDLWTGGKCMYKCEPIVEDGGELIIYAPHLTSFSVTHWRAIQRLGYHVRDYFLNQWDRFAGEFPAVLGHCALVKGAGTFEGAVETPRIDVTLATGIPGQVCEWANLGYRDPETVVLKQWERREEEGILVVKKAGETLYRP